MPLFSLQMNSMFKRGISPVEFIDKDLAQDISFVNLRLILMQLNLSS